MMLPRSFYARDAATVARDLVGKVLCVDGTKVRVTETEAYVGPHDLACHASRGMTKRTATMHGPPGHAYVYLIYGMYDMLNVVTGPEGHGEAVLIRAADPGDMDVRLDGPGRLSRALGIAVARDNGADLLDGRIWFEEGTTPRIAATPRIGIGYAGEWAAAPLRFVDTDSRHVSRAPKIPDATYPSKPI